MGAANTTQTVSPTQTTSHATTAVTTRFPQRPIQRVHATSTTTTAISTTHTTIPATSHTTTVVTTAAQSQVNPIIAFIAEPTDGSAPLDVQFSDMSTGGPTSWNWDFGDGTSDTSRSPSHTYSDAGTYTVRLTATTRTGSAVRYPGKLYYGGLGSYNNRNNNRDNNGCNNHYDDCH